MEEGESYAELQHSGVTTIVRQQTGDQLLVSACGRTCSVDMHCSRSIVDLQAALQRKLQMEGQTFHICDINGQLLSTDMQVADAISQGLTPLCATLPDKSLHHLENRREELAQMQWKLVRDQMTQSNNQVTQLTRQINEVQFQLQANHREATNEITRFKEDYAKNAEKDRLNNKADLQPVQEAVNGAVLLINGERGKRELSVQGFEKHIHGVCDMLDGERASRRQDLAMHMSVMQELRASLDAERNSRIELEDVVMEMKRSSAKFQDEVRANLREQSERHSKLQSDVSVTDSETMGRFTEMEDRLAMLENSMSEITSWTTSSLDKMTERHERVSQAVETMRLGNKHYEGGIANCLERTNDLEKLVRQYDGEMRDQMSKEKQVREDQVRRTSQVFTNESLKQITEVEKRLTIRLERESAEREKNFQSMIDEVTKICEDRKLFRDQTITKTVMAPQYGSSGQFETSGLLGSPKNSYQPSASEATIGEPYREGAHEKATPLTGSERQIRTMPLMANTQVASPVFSYTGLPPSRGDTPSKSNERLPVKQMSAPAYSQGAPAYSQGAPGFPFGSATLGSATLGVPQARPLSDSGSRSGSLRARVGGTGSGVVANNITMTSPRVPTTATVMAYPRMGPGMG